MILSVACQVAIKSLAYLSSLEEVCVNVKELAAATGENQHTIAKVLQKLAKENLLGSITGPHGGFFLTAAQRRQPLMQILKVIDGNEVVGGCVLGLKQCSDNHPCPVHDRYALIRKEFEEMLAKTTLDELGPVLEQGKVFLS